MNRHLPNPLRYVLAFTVCAAPAAALAADILWVGTNGDWGEAANWDPATVPLGPDHALLKSDDATSRTVSYAATNPAFELMSIDALGSGTMTLAISAGTLQTTGPQDTIGTDGRGAVTQTGGTYQNNSLLLAAALPASSGSYTLAGSGTLAVTNFEAVGANGQGSFTQTAGSHTLGTNLYLGYVGATSSGTYDLSGTGSLAVGGWEQVGRTGAGEFNQSGGTHTIGQNLSIARLSSPDDPNYRPSSTGTFNLSGGTITVTTKADATFQGVTNYIGGTFNYPGGSLIVSHGVFTNDGVLNIGGSGTRVVDGAVTNTSTGLIKVTDTTVQYTGTVTNGGAYVSDPSDNVFADLVVESSGYLQGQSGDRFLVGGNFTNDSVQNSLWETEDALLAFTGVTSSVHEYLLGEVAASFAWETLELAAGNALTILGSAPGTLFFDRISLGSESTLGSSLALAYGELWVAGQLVDEGGVIAPSIPEPATLALFGLGLAGFGVLRRRKAAA
jgi:hypothetical protein